MIDGLVVGFKQAEQIQQCRWFMLNLFQHKIPNTVGNEMEMGALDRSTWTAAPREARADGADGSTTKGRAQCCVLHTLPHEPLKGFALECTE